MRPTLAMTVGLPGAGKSTLAASSRFDGFKIINRDSIVLALGGQRPYNEAWDLVDHNEVNRFHDAEFALAVRRGQDILMDETFMRRAKRAKYINAAPGYFTIAYVFIASLQTVISRNHLRPGKVLELGVYYSMIGNYESPTPDEFDFLSYQFTYGHYEN